MLTVGSLFAGIGGFDLGLERAGMRVIWQSEIDPYASAVLRKHWPHVPNLGDVRSIRAGVERPDVICGGFPCQPYSVAGRQLGAEDDRALWHEYRRVVKELRPTWVFGENVVGFVNLALDDMLADLEALGYAWRPFVIPACALGAHHERRRVWIVAHAKRERGRSRDAGGKHAADAWESSRRSLAGHWDVEPDVGRVAHGVPSRMDRLRCLGNAIVPQIAEIIGRAIIAAEGMT